MHSENAKRVISHKKTRSRSPKCLASKLLDTQINALYNMPNIKIDRGKHPAATHLVNDREEGASSKWGRVVRVLKYGRKRKLSVWEKVVLTFFHCFKRALFKKTDWKRSAYSLIAACGIVAVFFSASMYSWLWTRSNSSSLATRA